MEISPDLLNRYLNGQCSLEEKKQVEVWLEAQKKKASNVPELQAEMMESRIWENLSEVVKEDPPTPVFSLYRRAIGYAAAAIILMTAGFFGYNYISNIASPNSEIAYLENIKTINTQRGEKRTVTLSDGSTIRMNYETEIRVPEKFAGNERIVYLTGHAHFDVARDTERPFIIYTEDSKTQVLGTSFDIDTKEEGETEIIVTSGKVAFSEKGKPDNLVTLTPNDRAVLGADKSIMTDEVDAFALTAWKDNHLVFDYQSLSEIIEVLEPWYDINVIVKDPAMLTNIYKLSYDNPSLESLMQQMSFVANFQYKIEGDTVTLY
ncbi:MAG: FecR domain-containing protein [Bacteroidota bacterium]